MKESADPAFLLKLARRTRDPEQARALRELAARLAGDGALVAAIARADRVRRGRRWAACAGAAFLLALGGPAVLEGRHSATASLEEIALDFRVLDGLSRDLSIGHPQLEDLATILVRSLPAEPFDAKIAIRVVGRSLAERRAPAAARSWLRAMLVHEEWSVRRFAAEWASRALPAWSEDQELRGLIEHARDGGR